MKKRSYPKAWDLNNVIISFDKSNTGFFLTQFFPLICLRSCGTTKILSYERLALQEGPCILLWELQVQLQQDFMSIPAFNPPLRITCKTWKTWCCVFLYLLSWGDSGPAQHPVCRHLSTQHSRAQPILSNGSGFWLHWEECWESRFSREHSFLQSSSCSC